MNIELKVPEMGESIVEVEIGEWYKAEGDFVDKDEIIVDLETDKATMELAAPAAGHLRQVLKAKGESVAIGDVIGRMEEGAAPAKAGKAAPTPAAAVTDGATSSASKAPSAPTDGARVMPAARRELEQRGISATDVEATGPGGRLLKEDVLRHASQADADATPPAAEPARAEGSRNEEVVPMSLMRRRIADRLVQSQQTAALLTTINEIDMTAVKELRSTFGDSFRERHGVKLGFMSFFVRAAVEALKRFPAINAEIRGTDVVYRDYFDIGIAVGGGRGLVVPVLRNAERMSFADVERAVADLAARARDNKLTIEELQGGTFTISNGGVYGSLLSTPIINPPQSGILGIHAIQERPITLDGQVVSRPMMYIALTYDHRIVDGRESVLFLRHIKESVEQPARILLEA